MSYISGKATKVSEMIKECAKVYEIKQDEARTFLVMKGYKKAAAEHKWIKEHPPKKTKKASKPKKARKAKARKPVATPTPPAAA